jgi:hypothetical protein
LCVKHKQAPNAKKGKAPIAIFAKHCAPSLSKGIKTLIITLPKKTNVDIRINANPNVIELNFFMIICIKNYIQIFSTHFLYGLVTVVNLFTVSLEGSGWNNKYRRLLLTR